MTRSSALAAVSVAVLAICAAPALSQQDGDCMCTMEYEPVCDIQGKKYSNKSCAACEGADPRGLFPCPEAEPPGGKPTENCTCTLDFLPVCESQNVVVGANECTAACKGYTTEQLKGCNPVAPATPSSEAEPCMCTFDYRPVCDYQGIPIAPNPCAADCLGYTSVQYQPCFKSLMQKPEAATVAGMRNVDKACVCPAIYDPVCDSLGKEVAPSACDADCSGLEGYLKCDAFSTTCPPPAGEPMPQPCIVTMEYSPQCMEGCEVGSNERDAMCKGYSKEQLAPCNPPVEPVNQIQPEVCICTEEYFPQCLPNGTVVGDNPCLATCNGYEGKFVPCQLLTVENDVPVKVEPKPPCKCTKEYVPYCDSHGTTVGSNKCNALCAGYDESEIEPCAAKVKDSVAAAVCPCTKELRRVCDMYGTELGPNPCNAECKGYDASEFSMEYCTTPAVEPCTTPCTLELEPVCDDKGTELGPNACAAVCKGYDSASFSTEYCTPRHQMTQLVTSITNQEPCMCTKEYSPVCDAKGTVVGPNLCSAQCAGYDGADLSTCSFVELPEAAQNGTQGIRDDLDRVARGGENLQTICVTPRQTGGPHLCTTFDTLIGFGNVTDDEVAGKPDPAGKSDPAGQADPAGKADAAGESAAAGLGPLGLLLATCALAVQLIA